MELLPPSFVIAMETIVDLLKVVCVRRRRQALILRCLVTNDTNNFVSLLWSHAKQFFIGEKITETSCCETLSSCSCEYSRRLIVEKLLFFISSGKTAAYLQAYR